ncbi:MAG: hypothetical protein RBU27_02885 [Bacteroidota bacterium]|jgi:hypothetical protein|nr:hypothetical protein [Bacteroidota bacterium]
MRMWKRHILPCILVLLFLPLMLAAQGVADPGGVTNPNTDTDPSSVTAGAEGTLASDSLTGPDSPGHIALAFERNVNTFLWDFTGSWHGDAGPFRIRADERFQRMLIRTERTSVKDEQAFGFGAEHDLAPDLSIIGSFSSFLFSDNRALALNDLSVHKAQAGVRWRPFPQLHVAPTAGVSFDNQQGIGDHGLMYSADVRLRDLTIGRTATVAEWYSSAEYIDPRFQQEHRGAADFLAGFAEDGQNHLQLQFRSLRREFYLPYDSALDATRGVAYPIESRDEQVVTLGNTLQYRVFDPLRMIAGVDLTQRDITRARPQRNPDDPLPFFDADIGEFRLNGSLQFLYDNGSGTTGQLRMELNERDELHEIRDFDGASSVSFARQQSLERQKNNSIRQTQIGLQVAHALSDRDTVWFSASTVKMQYDTPSDENHDDRDELFVLAGVRWSHRFSPRFLASIATDFNLRHTVFIFSERSANNTWNRVLRLAPSTEYRSGASFISRNGAEVVANYTVYDFESAGQSQRSFSLRQLTLTDSTVLHLGGNIWSELQLHFRFYERGELHWSAFTLRPLQFFDERTLAFSLLRLGESVRAAVGFRLFEQRRYGYTALTRQPAGTLRSYGPTASMRLRLSDATDILAEGWLQFTSEDERPVRTTTNISVRMLWNL